MRGLKLNNKRFDLECEESHLLQMRGLKRTRRANSSHSKLVASFTDAWIETLGSQAGLATCLSHLLQMRGLKRLPSTIDARTLKSHLLQMRGLKHEVANVTLAL